MKTLRSAYLFLLALPALLSGAGCARAPQADSQGRAGAVIRLHKPITLRLAVGQAPSLLREATEGDYEHSYTDEERDNATANASELGEDWIRDVDIDGLLLGVDYTVTGLAEYDRSARYPFEETPEAIEAKYEELWGASQDPVTVTLYALPTDGTLRFFVNSRTWDPSASGVQQNRTLQGSARTFAHPYIHLHDLSPITSSTITWYAQHNQPQNDWHGEHYQTYFPSTYLPMYGVLYHATASQDGTKLHATTASDVPAAQAQDIETIYLERAVAKVTLNINYGSASNSPEYILIPALSYVYNICSVTPRKDNTDIENSLTSLAGELRPYSYTSINGPGFGIVNNLTYVPGPRDDATLKEGYYILPADRFTYAQYRPDSQTKSYTFYIPEGSVNIFSVNYIWADPLNRSELRFYTPGDSFQTGRYVDEIIFFPQGVPQTEEDLDEMAETYRNTHYTINITMPANADRWVDITTQVEPWNSVQVNLPAFE